jgi:shikimate dehydrogenase
VSEKAREVTAMALEIDGKTRLAGVAGWPISHSLSPQLHNYWFARHGGNGVYVPLAIRPEDFADVLQSLAKMGFRGINVTLPHKVRAFELIDDHDQAAKRMQAVNTVLIGENGNLFGRNTDGFGFYANLRQQAPEWRPEQGGALLLGTGGAARAIAFELLEQGVKKLVLTNRTLNKAQALAEQLAAWFSVEIELVDWSRREWALESASLCVNCTSLGMSGQPPLELQLNALPKTAVVADIVYSPLKTALLAQAEALGLVVVDGLGMLLYQAIPGFRHWGGVEAKIDETCRQMMVAALTSRC